MAKKKHDAKGAPRGLPTAGGGISRFAYDRAARTGLDIKGLLARAGLNAGQIADPQTRIAVPSQIRFLNLVADALQDEFLGLHLAERYDLRETGLLYYVGASSATLGEALQRLARYSTLVNEGTRIGYRDQDGLTITFEYVGTSRAKDRHQIEFFVVTLLRLCREFAGRALSPKAIRLVHRRAGLPAKWKALFRCPVKFGSDVDEVSYPKTAVSMPVISADPYLNELLLNYCEEARSRRGLEPETWRARVENAIAPLLPHGQAKAEEISKRLGRSQRTLTRLLAVEGVTFSDVLDDLRHDLARRYLKEPDLPISKVAWLLGYRETSAFNHAFRRWTGTTPRRVRSRTRS